MNNNNLEIKNLLDIHIEIKEKLNFFIENKKIPNIMFYGPNGSGKKTLVNEFINKIYNNDLNLINKYVFIIDCSFGKGIKFIREELKYFAKTNINYFDGKLVKCIILINADKLTIDAQSALRRCIELYTFSTRFFLIIEDKYKILKPIISRFSEIFVNIPIYKGEKINLFKYHWYSDNYKLIEKEEMNNNIKKIKKNLNLYHEEKKNLIEISEILYNNAIIAKDLIEYIETSFKNSGYKYKLILFIEKIKKEFRNEKLLIFIILNFIIFRFDFNLENINSL